MPWAEITGSKEHERLFGGGPVGERRVHGAGAAHVQGHAAATVVVNVVYDDGDSSRMATGRSYAIGISND
ncbi:hypothetical protein [Streptomyces sp. NPDC046685]|uniref:hypothetical protein n=1 Tax=Streptomyces sp. NPDC046685 TaxID=3157202 RepID=UPI0033E2A78D